jgi:transcriptional regulator with XRE-family HTH domain
MPQGSISVLNRVLVCLRSAQEMSQEDLGRASGISPKLISAYENGKNLSRERLETFVRSMSLPIETIDWMSSALRSIEAVGMRLRAEEDREHQRIELLVARGALATAELLRATLRRTSTEAEAIATRRGAPHLLARFLRRSVRERQLLLEESREFRSWGLVELLCKRSLEAATADGALEHAALAVEIAEKLEGSALFERVKGLALVHLANARRVKGAPREAEGIFRKGKALWAHGRSADPGLFDEALILGLEASLRMDLRELLEARSLIEAALEADNGTFRRELLIYKANILKNLGEYGGAIATLEQLLPLLEEGDPLTWYARHNLAVTLCRSGRHLEAESMLPALRTLSLEAERPLDRVRFRWLEGQVAAAGGRFVEAAERLSGVRDAFAEESIPYDTALVTLELAAVYLDLGRTAEVKRLARDLALVFKAEGVHREALAALRLFASAAEEETATAEMARQIVAYLYRAEYNPGVGFSSQSL